MRCLFVVLPMLVLASAAAMADSLEIHWREARVIRLPKAATSVVVGDPTVADVTLDDPQTLIVFGKTPGETNLVILSGSQEQLADWSIMVAPTNKSHVTVLNTASESPTEVLYACGGERCTRVLSPTDVEFRSSSTSTTSNDSGAAKTTSTAESAYATGGTTANNPVSTPAPPPGTN